MSNRILKCVDCNAYTMKEVHDCGAKSVICVPAKWSPEDKYGAYRREARRDEMIKKGLL